MSDLENVKKNLRSVLLSSKQGIVAKHLQREYRELNGEFIPHQKLSFCSLEEFIRSLSDVCRVGYNNQNELTYFALTDGSTQHIKKMVANQRPGKKKSKPSSFKRNQFAQRPKSQYHHGSGWFNAPPRFRKHNTIKTTFKQHTVHVSPNTMTINVKNPQYTSNKVAPATPAVVKSNLANLLKSNPAGIHSCHLARLYKETFKQELPDKFVQDILDGKLPEYARVDKISIGNETKAILLSVNKVQTKRNMQQATNLQIMEEFVIKEHFVLEIEKNYKVSIQHVESCDQVFVQIFEDANSIKQMQTLIKSLHPSLKTCQSSLKPGSYVTTDCFLRAKAIQVTGDEVEIYNIDVGTTYFVSLGSLRYMNSSIASYPVFGIRCSLSRLNKGGSWSEDATKFCLKLISVGMSMIMKVVQIPTTILADQEYSVILYSEKPSRNLNARVLDDELSLMVARTVKFSNPFRFQPKSCAKFPNDEYLHLFILSVLCTTEVEVCIVGEQYSYKLCQLESAMLAFYNKPENRGVLALPQPPPLNCVYAVLQEETCVRGKLISINGNEAEVYLVDNAAFETVAISCLHPLKYAYSQFPTQVVTVSLAGLEQPTLANHSTILQYLSENIDNKPCVAKIVGRFGEEQDQIVVELLDTSGSVDVHVNKVCRSLVYSPKHYPSPDTTVPVIVRHIDQDAGLIFLNISGENLTALHRGMNEIQSMISPRRSQISKLATDLYIGKECLACISGSYYRVVIEEFTNQKPRDVKVFLIDVGRMEYISQGALLKMASESLLSIPPQAECCKISSPQETKEMLAAAGDFLHMNLTTAIDQLTTSESVIARFDKIESSDGGPHCISLWIDSPMGMKTRIISDDEEGPRVDEVRDRSRSFSSTSSSLLNSPLSTNSSTPALHDSFSSMNLVGAPKIETPDSAAKHQVYKTKDINHNTEIILSSISPNTLALAPRVNKHESPPKPLRREDVVLPSNSLIPVRVENVISPIHFNLILLDDLQKRDHLRKTMTAFYRKRPSQSKVALNQINCGSVYAAAYEDDAGVGWHRVKVQSSINGQVCVYFLDYGMCDVISDTASFYRLEKGFEILPPLSLVGRLAGIQPLDDAADWDDETCDRFTNLVINRDFYAQFFRMKLDLDDRMPDCRVFNISLCDTKTGVDVWINDVLVDIWNCAEYVA
uniref:uncharacterized protein LOC100183257 n=1 Tax=Ciona intestinalis TaxID=7719 RepID=UPI0002B8EC5E|nr:uncharacterized protein LOC100183257 [Ciona intestinalis]|eukprot:XP_026691845.1 uncharacterized protein LOC100183257 [Ciona intestinalis]